AAAPSPPAPGGELRARARAGAPADIAKFAARQALCVVVRPPQAPEDALFADEGPWRFAVGRAGAAAGVRADASRSPKRAKPDAVGPEGVTDVLVGDCGGPEEIVAACGARPVVVHDAKALRGIPEQLAHDTLLGAYLLEPARRGYPFAE